MAYAAEGKISQDPIEGGIEITEEQYAQALDGMCEGLVVTVKYGFKIVPAPEPVVEPVPDPTPEELAQAARSTRDQLLLVAAIRIDPLQDAVDLGDASDAEVSSLERWKQYRVALNRVELQPGFPTMISWPVAPGQSNG